MQYKDYYKILGVDRSSTEAQIKSAYRKLARKFHPDVNKSSDAVEKFKDINEAYEVLSDKDKRKRYDSLGANWQAGAEFTPPPGFEGFSFNQGGRGFDQASFSQGFSDLGGFSDFFSSIFGDFSGASQSGAKKTRGGSRFSYNDFSDFGGRSSARSQTGRAQAGRAAKKPTDLDVTQDLYVSAKDLMSDTPITVRLNTLEKCHKCSGVGSVCYACGGTGFISETKSLNVKLPKGVREGQKIRLAKEGKANDYGEKGDLYFVIKFKDSEYTINDDDLTKQLDITPSQAVMGCKKEIQTLHGVIGIKIPPETHSGKTLRLKDLGLPKKEGGFGNLNVKININLPAKLTEKQKDLYKKLFDIENP